MLRSTITVSFLAALGTAISLLNQLVLARYFGTTGEMDSYLISISLPLTISSLLAGVFSYQLVPALQRADLGAGGADSLIRSLAQGVGWVTLAIGIIGAIASGPLIQLLNPKLPNTEYELTSRLAHITWLCLPFAAVSTIFTAGLHVRNRFIISTMLAFSPMAVSLLACVLGHSQFGVSAAVVGQFAGYVLMAVGLKWALRTEGKEKDWPSFRRVLLRLPLALGAVLIFVIFPFSDAFWGSRIGPAAVSYLGFAQRILVGLSGLAVVGATTVLFPRLAKLAAKGEADEMRKDLRLSIRAMLACMVPLSTAFGVLAMPIVRLLFERGAFRHSDSVALSGLIQLMLVGMIAMSCMGLLFKGVFAREEAGFAAFLSLFGSCIYFGFSGVLGMSSGIQGIGYAYSAAWWIIFIIGLRHIWSGKPLIAFVRAAMAYAVSLICLALVVALVCCLGFRVIELVSGAAQVLQATIICATIGLALITSLLVGNYFFAVPEIQVFYRHFFAFVRRW